MATSIAIEQWSHRAGLSCGAKANLGLSTTNNEQTMTARHIITIAEGSSQA